MVVASERVAGGTAASSLTAGGILGFYILVVYAIGRALRSACGGSRYKLIFDEMPEVHDLVRMPGIGVFGEGVVDIVVGSEQLLMPHRRLICAKPSTWQGRVGTCNGRQSFMRQSSACTDRRVCSLR